MFAASYVFLDSSYFQESEESQTPWLLTIFVPVNRSRGLWHTKMLLGALIIKMGTTVRVMSELIGSLYGLNNLRTSIIVSIGLIDPH